MTLATDGGIDAMASTPQSLLAQRAAGRQGENQVVLVGA
jgi:hypothetical protein